MTDQRRYLDKKTGKLRIFRTPLPPSYFHSFQNQFYSPYYFQDPSQDMSAILTTLIQCIFPFPKRTFPYFNENDEEVRHGNNEDLADNGEYLNWLHDVVDDMMSWWTDIQKQWSPGLENSPKINTPYENNASNHLLTPSFQLQDVSFRFAYIQNNLPAQVMVGSLFKNLFYFKYGLSTVSSGGGEISIPSNPTAYQQMYTFLSGLPTSKVNGRSWLPDVGVSDALWGTFGSLQLTFPSNWEYGLVMKENSYQNYGAVKGFPLPMVITDKWIMEPLPTTASLPNPSPDLLNYWFDLINTFRKKNPRLIIQSYNPTTPDKNSDTTDRYGWKDDRNGKKLKDINLTSDMEAVDTKYMDKLPTFHEYIKSWNDAYVFCGLFQEGKINKDVDKWIQAVYQALHLRLAERHYFAPWSRYMNCEQTTSSFPPSSTIDLNVHNTGLGKIDWPSAIWDDDYKNGNKDHDEQRPPEQGFGPAWGGGTNGLSVLAKKKVRNISPYLITDTILFNKAGDIISSIYFQKKSGKTTYDIGEENKDAFGKWIFHYRLIVEGGYDYFGTVYNHQTYWGSVLGVGPLSSWKTWDDCIQYHLEDFYQNITTAPVDAFNQTGYPSIRPSDPGNENPPPSNGGGRWEPGRLPTYEAQESQFLLWMEQQWRDTEHLLDWPKIYINKTTGAVRVVKEKEKSFFQKWIDTFMSVFGEVDIPAGWDPNGAQDAGNNEIMLTGWFLPPSKLLNQRIIDLYAFMRSFILPPLQGTPLAGDDPSWEQRKTEQWAAYIDWVRKNLLMEYAAQKWRENNHISPDDPVVPPGFTQTNEYFKDAKGNFITVPGVYNGDPPYRLINSIPDLGVFDTTGSKGSFDWIFHPNEWPKVISGDNEGLIQALLRFFKYVVNAVVDTITDIINNLLKDAGGLIGGNLILILLVGAAGILGFNYVNHKMTS